MSERKQKPLSPTKIENKATALDEQEDRIRGVFGLSGDARLQVFDDYAYWFENWR